MIQGPVFDAAFWLNFWPQLAATIVGVLIGVPAGLWLNRKATDVASAAQQRADAERLDGALASLVASIERNRVPLQRMAELKAGTWLLEPGVETTTWEAVKSEIVSLVRIPELQRSLAAHFASTEQAVRLCDLLAQHSIGVQASMSNADRTREAIMNRLNEVAAATVAQADALLKAIAEVRTDVAKK